MVGWPEVGHTGHQGVAALLEDDVVVDRADGGFYGLAIPGTGEGGN